MSTFFLKKRKKQEKNNKVRLVGLEPAINPLSFFNNRFLVNQIFFFF